MRGFFATFSEVQVRIPLDMIIKIVSYVYGDTVYGYYTCAADVNIFPNWHSDGNLGILWTSVWSPEGVQTSIGEEWSRRSERVREPSVTLVNVWTRTGRWIDYGRASIVAGLLGAVHRLDGGIIGLRRCTVPCVDVIRCITGVYVYDGSSGEDVCAPPSRLGRRFLRTWYSALRPSSSVGRFRDATSPSTTRRRCLLDGRPVGSNG